MEDRFVIIFAAVNVIDGSVVVVVSVVPVNAAVAAGVVVAVVVAATGASAGASVSAGSTCCTIGIVASRSDTCVMTSRTTNVDMTAAASTRSICDAVIIFLSRITTTTLVRTRGTMRLIVLGYLAPCLVPYNLVPCNIPGMIWV